MGLRLEVGKGSGRYLTKFEVIDSLFAKRIFDVARLLYEGVGGFVLASGDMKRRERVAVGCAAFSKACGKCCALIVPKINEVKKLTSKIVSEYPKVRALDLIGWRGEEERRGADVLVMSYEKFNNMLYWKKGRPNIKAVIFYKLERVFWRKPALLKAIIHRLKKLDEKRRRITNYYIIMKEKRPKNFLLKHFHHAFWREKLEEEKTIKIINDYEKTVGKTFERREKREKTGEGVFDEKRITIQISMFLILISRRRQLKSRLLEDVRDAFPEEDLKQEKIVEIFNFLEEKGLIIRKKHVRKQESATKNGEKTGEEKPVSLEVQRVYFIVSGNYQATNLGERAAKLYTSPKMIAKIQENFSKKFKGETLLESYISFLCKESNISNPKEAEKTLEKLKKREKITEKEREKIERLAAPLHTAHKIITESEAYKLIKKKEIKQRIEEVGNLLNCLLKAKVERDEKGERRKRKKYWGSKLVEMVVKCVYANLIIKQKERKKKKTQKNGSKKPLISHRRELKYLQYVTVANILNIPKRTVYYIMKRYLDHETPDDPWLKHLKKNLPKRLIKLINETVEKTCFSQYKQGTYRPQTVIVALTRREKKI